LDIVKVVVEDNARREIDDIVADRVDWEIDDRIPIDDDDGDINAEDKRENDSSSSPVRGVIPLFSRALLMMMDRWVRLWWDEQCADFLFDM